jgi:hypothetical protein
MSYYLTVLEVRSTKWVLHLGQSQGISRAALFLGPLEQVILLVLPALEAAHIPGLELPLTSPKPAAGHLQTPLQLRFSYLLLLLIRILVMVTCITTRGSGLAC